MRVTTNAARAFLLLAVGMALAVPAVADEWDLGEDTDNGGATDNALLHGSEQTHDLAAQALGQADEDWYLLQNRPFSSYQVVVDGMTGDLDLAATDLQRLDVSGQQVLQSALLTDFGGSATLNWQSAQATIPANFIRIQDAACGTSCDAADRYRVRFYDTTYTIPRFNNTGSQVTVLLIQNAIDRSCAVNTYFFGAGGNLLASTGTMLGPSQLYVLPVSAFVELAGQSGSIRVTHDCGYGGLSGKAVSVEPATGFTFDTQMQHRPH